MAKRILFLDDDKYRHETVRPMLLHDAAFTAREAIDALTARTYDVVFLDHDLGDRQHVDSHGPEETGYTVAKWIAEHRPAIPLVVVHSMNPVGAGNISSLLRRRGYLVVESSFRVLKADLQWILDWEPSGGAASGEDAPS